MLGNGGGGSCRGLFVILGMVCGWDVEIGKGVIFRSVEKVICGFYGYEGG